MKKLFTVGTELLRNKAVTAAKLYDGTNETAWVGGRIAALSYSAVGSYMLMTIEENQTITCAMGATIAGSYLRAAAIHLAGDGSLSLSANVAVPAGTWLNCGNDIASTDQAGPWGYSLMRRIA